MNTTHLNDPILQAYADGDSSARTESVESHIRSCATCRGQVAVYQAMRSHLKNTDEFVLPADFSAMVVDRIEAIQEKQARWKEWLWMSPLVAIGAGATIYYSKIPMSSEPVSDLVSKNIRNTRDYLPLLEKMGGWMGDNIHYLFFGLFLVLLFDLLDKKLRVKTFLNH